MTVELGVDRTTIIIVPVLARPHRVLPTLESIASATTSPHRVLFVVSDSDAEERDALEDAGAEHLVVDDRHGSYPCKVNRAYKASSEPLLFLAADDLDFHPGWLEAATGQLAHGAMVVGTNDLGNARVLAGTHSTHTLVTRGYADSPGATADRRNTVLHEGYRHWYCDDELVGVARRRGVYSHAHDAVVEHLHPYHGKADRDRTYAAGEAGRRLDRREHARRLSMWEDA